VKALYPLSSGKLYLPPRVLKAKAAIPSPAANQPIDPFDPFNSGGLFDSFFQRVQYQSISLKSNEIKLDVQPLPQAPADIQALLGPVPIVGSTSVSVDSDVSISKVGESKTLTFHVVSEGNINPLTTLPLVVPEGVKSYEERPETKRERKGAKLLLHRYFRFSIVPLKPGLIKIPPARVAFFSPSTGRYEVASSKEIAFAVQGQPIDSSAATGPARASTASSGAIPTMPPLPFGPDLEYEAATLVERVTELFSLKSALLALSGVIGLLGIIALFLKLRPAPPPEGLSSADLAQVTSLDSLERFIRNLLARRLKGLKPESSLDEIRARIAAEIQNQESALTLRTILDELEVLRYGGPQGTAPSQLDALKDRLNPLLRALTSGR